MIKVLFIEAGIFVLTAILIGIFVFYLVCCIPYLIFKKIRDAYRDDRATIKMFKDIDNFLREQRTEGPEDGYQQICAW